MSALFEQIKALLADSESRRKVLMYLLFGGGAVVLYTLLKRPKQNALPGYVSPTTAPPTDDSYDVAIIGAGPSGATCAYYLRKKGRKVLLLEKAKFPRDKYCGDAVTTLAQKHLKEMGVLEELRAADQLHWSQSGGFVSPGGYSFIGNSAKELKNEKEGVVVAIKRVDMDEKVARAAARAGAHLLERHEVLSASLDPHARMWTVKALRSEGDEATAATTEVQFRARLLVAADGAPSKLARQLGLIRSEPEGVCSRSYIQGDHKFNCDGVVFYPPQLLPGYCSLLMHAKNELAFCAYIIPGGPCTNNDLHRVHHDIIKSDPFVSRALAGESVRFERMKGASLRLGAQERTYADQLLVIGDAAGFIDPLTGEGIQYAMESGQMAAECLVDALLRGDLSAAQMRTYEQRWYRDWGREFYWSMKMSLFLYRFPILLDAAAKLIGKRGARFLADWAQVMTGTQSKLWFVRPDVGPLLVVEAVGIWIRRLLGLPEKK